MGDKRSKRFEVQVQALDGTAPEPRGRALAFEVQNHDDILAIAERVRSAAVLPDADANALAVGLKLFSGVMLAHPELSMFADLRPAMHTFIRNLKSQVAAASA